jgi:hypothetical protein
MAEDAPITADMAVLLESRFPENCAAALAIRTSAGPERVWTPNATDEPAFLAYSITKTFTAALILRLCDEGALALDDRIARWFPSIPRADDIERTTSRSGICSTTRPGSRITDRSILFTRASAHFLHAHGRSSDTSRKPSSRDCSSNRGRDGRTAIRDTCCSRRSRSE